MKKTIALLLACVLCLSLTACRTEATPYGGNTNGNIANGGLVAAANGRIYYSNVSDGGKLYSMKPDGSSKKKICEDSASYINVMGNKIYYSNGSDKGNLYVINIDGTDRQKLYDNGFFPGAGVSFIHMVSDRIYFITYDGPGPIDRPIYALYSIKADSTDPQKLTNAFAVWCFDVVDGRIYFPGYSMKTDGTDPQKLSGVGGGVNGNDFTIAGGRVYFCNSSDGNSLYVRDFDGGNPQKLNDVSIDFVNIANGCIYYSNGSDGESLYSMKMDGSSQQKLNNEPSASINIAGGRIYYMSGGAMYSVKMDGSGRQAVT